MKGFYEIHKKKLINGLIASYLFAIFLHGLPLDALLFNRVKEITTPPVLALGIWQGWNMFAPNPLRFDVNIYARLYYKDGTVITKNIEESLDDNFLYPFRLVRWTKWAKDNVRQENHQVLWEPALRYMVDKYAEKDNPIIKGQLLRRFVEVKLLNKEKSDMIPLKEFRPKLSKEVIFFQIPEEKKVAAK